MWQLSNALKTKHLKCWCLNDQSDCRSFWWGIIIKVNWLLILRVICKDGTLFIIPLLLIASASVIPGNYINAKENVKTTVPCGKGKVMEGATITWTRHGADVTKSLRFTVLAKTGGLLINTAKRDDSGLYQCSVKKRQKDSGAIMTLSHQMYLNVQCKYESETSYGHKWHWLMNLKKTHETRYCQQLFSWMTFCDRWLFWHTVNRHVYCVADEKNCWPLRPWIHGWVSPAKLNKWVSGDVSEFPPNFACG